MTYPTPPGPQADPNDFLMGGGTKSTSFDGVAPITWAGTVMDPPNLIQKRHFDTSEPLTWPDGRPKMLMQVNIQTDVRDPADPEDTGVRALYLEFKKLHAVRDAVKTAGAVGVEPGGFLSLTWTHGGDRQPGGKGFTPKEYKAEYRPPNPLEQADPWAGVQPGATSPSVTYNAPAQSPATPPAAVPQQIPVQVAGDPLIAFLAAKGIPGSENMTPEQRRGIASTYPDCPR